MSSNTSPTFVVPWAPSLNGNELRKCDSVADLIEYGMAPSFRKPSDRAWTEAMCESELAGAPVAAREAIMETVVAVWRLREKQLVSGDPLWKDHLEAWLVRGDWVSWLR